MFGSFTAGAIPAGQEAPDPMILVSVMGTVQYGQLEAKPPPEARPFAQTFVRTVCTWQSVNAREFLVLRK